VFEVRIHGRGGQGVVTAAELLSVAAFDGGKHAQAFPSFGSERTGAPVRSDPKLGNACAWDPPSKAATDSSSAAVTTP